MGEHERTPDSGPARNPRRARWLARSLWGLTLACTAGAILLILLGPRAPQLPDGDRGATIFLALVFLAFGSVGALVAARHPGNALGWLFCAAGLAYGVVVCARTYALAALFAAPGRFPGGTAAAWLAAWLTLPPAFLIAIFLPLLFPTGRPPTPRWRPLARLSPGGLAVLTLAVAVARRLQAGLVLLPLCAPAATPRWCRAPGARAATSATS